MSAAASVTSSRRPMWLLRLRGQAGHIAVALLALSGLMSLARSIAAGPPTGGVRPAAVAVRWTDTGGAGFAALFARLYLTWSAADTEMHSRALAGLLAPTVDPDLGLMPAAGTSRRVAWTEVVRRSGGGGDGTTLYTVAADCEPGGLLYLSVPVRSDALGHVALAGHPAMVGPPATAPYAGPSSGAGPVTDAALLAVLQRALRNYLAGATSDLAADLAPGVTVSSPPQSLTLAQLTQVRWLSPAREVDAQLQAADAAGTQYTLAYRVRVVRSAARWEIASIQP